MTLDSFVLFAVLGSIIFGLVLLVFRFTSFFYGGFFEMQMGFKKLTPEQISIIEQRFDYYQKLPPRSKKLFLKKALYFLNGNNFIPRKNLIITDEIKMYVCGAAAQITFGLPLLKLPSFRDILIFPTKYYNRTTKHHHVGEVNTKGIIVLSWEHIVRGFNNPTDGYNVALHELAHALRLEDFYPNEESNFFEQEDISYLHHLYGKEKKRARQGQKMFLRKYAFSNLEEFFAVSVEYFFEQPLSFKAKDPKLYQCICNILRQDPALLEEMNKN